LIAIPSEDPFVPNPSGSVWRISTVGNVHTEYLLQIQGDVFRYQGYRPILSPDHQHLAYTVGLPSESDELRIYGIQTQIDVLSFSESGDWNGWSPDGQHFLLTRGSQRSLYLGGLGLNPFPIQIARNPRWLDAKHFVFLMGTAGNWSLVQGDLDGSTRVLMEIAAEDVSYDFTP
jgi:hypothetical protein